MAYDKNPTDGKAWMGRVETCRSAKRDMIRTWQTSVDYRRGKPFRTPPTEDTINVPADWSRTKNKAAQLFYQVPELKLTARRPEYVGATATFASALNFQLVEKVRAQFMMNECLSDVINAAGIAICKVGYEATFEQVEMPPEVPPTVDPMMGAMDPLADPLADPMTMGGVPAGPSEMPEPMMVPRPVYECYYARRISPAHFLWPIEWTGSDWSQVPWIGWEGYLPLAEAKRRGWVDDEFKGVEMTDPDWFLVRDFQDFQKCADKYVKFSEIFYRPAVLDAAEKDHQKIRRIVLVDGNPQGKEVVVDEDFQWQRYVPETRKWVGMTSFPIKVLTLTNISDMAIPPSDSEIGRPQVRELIKARSQMMRQREMSLPLRWFDVNSVDEVIADRLRKGKWQDMIPMNGPGDNAIGEVARANFPRETFTFNDIASKDLDDAWSIGQPQQGSQSNQKGDTTATEVKTANAALNVRLEFERNWVLQFFLEVAEAVGNLMQLFSDDEDFVEVVGPDGVKKLQPWNKQTIAGEFIFRARPDSQLRLDVNQKRTEALNLYKLVRKDPLINPQELVKDLLELHGFDPSKTMVPPPPSTPPPPKMNYSFKGEDLLNPYTVAIAQKVHNITPEDIAKAKALIADAAGLLPPQAPTDPNAQAMAGAGGENPGHGGPADVVQPLNQRYNDGDGASGGAGEKPDRK